VTARVILTPEEEATYRTATGKITPSRASEQHWDGQWREGEVFSVGQLYELAVMGIDPKTVDRLDVIAPGDPNRLYLTRPWALSYRQVIYFYRRLTCPIIGTKGDRVHVITPAGHRKFVYPNGEISRPRNRRAA